MNNYFGFNLKPPDRIRQPRDFFSHRWPVTYRLPRCLGRPLWAPVLGPWSSDLNVVSSYGIAMMRRNHFANLWWWRWSTLSWWWWHPLVEGWHWWAVSTARLQLWEPSCGSRPSLARGWVRKLQSGLWWCDNGEGRWLGFGSQKLKIYQWGSSIYRVLGTES
jgi:hypothetical protein